MSLFRRTEANQHLHSSRIPRARFWKPRSCLWKARSAHLRDLYQPLAVQIRSRDQSPHRNSGIGLIVNNSSITLSCISLSLSLSPFCYFPFFFGATWLSRRRCIDSSASIRSTIYAATILPASLVFLSPFSSSFFFSARHRKRQREHKPPDDGIHRAAREETRSFSNLSRVCGNVCGNKRKVDNCLLLF